MTSSMVERVILMMVGHGGRRQSHGRHEEVLHRRYAGGRQQAQLQGEQQDEQQPQPKAGIEVRMRALNKLAASMKVYCLIADITPTGMPMRTEMATPQKVSVSVVGKREAISLTTCTLLR